MNRLTRAFLAAACIALARAATGGPVEDGIQALRAGKYERAIRAFESAAANGDVAAQINLGNLYMKGLGVEQNYPEALRWYRKAADQQERLAENKLGVMYYYGLGTEQDSAEAARWFERAARHGDVAAQSVLGSLYAAGDGVKRDLAQAYYWYSLAADAGDVEAIRGRDSLKDELTPGQMDDALGKLDPERKRRQNQEDQSLEAVIEKAVADHEAAPKPESADVPSAAPKPAHKHAVRAPLHKSKPVHRSASKPRKPKKH